MADPTSGYEYNPDVYPQGVGVGIPVDELSRLSTAGDEETRTTTVVRTPRNTGRPAVRNLDPGDSPPAARTRPTNVAPTTTLSQNEDFSVAETSGTSLGDAVSLPSSWIAPTDSTCTPATASSVNGDFSEPQISESDYWSVDAAVSSTASSSVVMNRPTDGAPAPALGQNGDYSVAETSREDWGSLDVDVSTTDLDPDISIEEQSTSGRDGWSLDVNASTIVSIPESSIGGPETEAQGDATFEGSSASTLPLRNTREGVPVATPHYESQDLVADSSPPVANGHAGRSSRRQVHDVEESTTTTNGETSGPNYTGDPTLRAVAAADVYRSWSRTAPQESPAPESRKPRCLSWARITMIGIAVLVIAVVVMTTVLVLRLTQGDSNASTSSTTGTQGPSPSGGSPTASPTSSSTPNSNFSSTSAPTPEPSSGEPVTPEPTPDPTPEPTPPPTPGWNLPTHLPTPVDIETIRDGPLLPEVIASLTDLKRLNLEFRGLTGTLPDEIRLLTNLKRLNLAGNELTGAIPSAIGLLTSMEYLWLQRNDFTSLPDEIGLMTSLRKLKLHHNSIGGTIPEHIYDLKNLETLTLFGNEFTGTFTCPDSIWLCLISCEETWNESCRTLW